MQILIYLSSYLIGSISSAISISNMMGLPDPRKHGSLNPGATNMLRISGKQVAILTLLGDFFKGAFVISLTKYLELPEQQIVLAACFAFVGHLYPIYYKFKGGKGVAVTLGLLFALNYHLALIALISWCLIAYLFRYSSLAALITAPLIMIVNIFVYHNIYYTQILLVISLFFLFSHRNNIVNLLNGKEPKLFQ